MAMRTNKIEPRHPNVGMIDDVAVFVAVAQHASFVAASRETGVTTSSVSRAVARLEDALATRLLQRSSRKVVLTDAGRQLLLHAAPHVAGLGEALAVAADRHPEPSGTVRVTAPAYTGSTRIADALARFALAHPKIRIELDATNTIRDVLEDGYDFAIRVGAKVDASFVARRIFHGAFGLFATPGFVKRVRTPREPVGRELLERAPCVVSRVSARWTFRQAASGAVTEVAPRVHFAVNDPRAAVAVAARGVGFVVAPLEAADAEPRLVRVTSPLGEPVPLELYLVYPSRRLLPVRVRLAIDWLVSALAA